MGISQAFKMAIKSILSNKVRAFLTMLGVIIGVGAVISAVAYAQGSTKNITDSIQSLGTNLIQISITGRNSNRNLSYDALQNFAEENSSEIDAISPTSSGSGTVKVGNLSKDTTILGTNPDYETVKSTHVSTGRFLSDFDIYYKLKVVLIGTAVSKKVFPNGESPIGQTVKINNQEFTVVGILEETASSQDSSDDDKVIIPITTAQRLMKNTSIRSFYVQAASSDTVDSVTTKLNSFLLSIYKSTKTFRVSSQEQMLSTVSSVTSTMMTLLGGVATISLVVGGIGIMNIMLVSVTERTREIGIRKAIGAKKKNILLQFLIEAVVVTGIGGIAGVLFGFAIIKFVLEGMDIVPAVYSMTWSGIAFGISLLIGVIFGMFPANKAAKLNPIEALRFE